jgi:hypothetical protein
MGGFLGDVSGQYATPGSAPLSSKKPAAAHSFLPPGFMVCGQFRGQFTLKEAGKGPESATRHRRPPGDSVTAPLGLARLRVCIFGTPFRLRDNLLVLPPAAASIRAFFLDSDLAITPFSIIAFAPEPRYQPHGPGCGTVLAYSVSSEQPEG